MRGMMMDLKLVATKSMVDRSILQENINLSNTIDRFRNKMIDKIAKYVTGGDGVKAKRGWDDEQLAAEMLGGLEGALEDGDYVSVANYAMSWIT